MVKVNCLKLGRCFVTGTIGFKKTLGKHASSQSLPINYLKRKFCRMFTNTWLLCGKMLSEVQNRMPDCLSLNFRL